MGFNVIFCFESQVKNMIEIKLSNGKLYKFVEDISMKALHDLGSEPIATDPQDKIMEYNKKKLIAFSVEPKLTMEMVQEMGSFDFFTLFKGVLLVYNQKMQHFLQAPQK